MVGSLLGAGSIATSFTSLNWVEMIKIVGSWFASPAVSIVLAMCLMSMVTFVMSTSKVSFKMRIYMCLFIGSFCVTMMAYLFNKILNTGKSPFDETDNPGLPQFLGYSEGEYFCFLIVGAAYLGLILVRLIMYTHLLCLADKKYKCGDKLYFLIVCIFLPFYVNQIERLTLNIKVRNGEEYVKKDEYVDEATLGRYLITIK